ncbi:acyl-CoA oxidase [Cavenderia fasciculata]|uniref:Acyl-CoA oxidase n=1 Tax=Cavenderia fasciculata TaxID=261658 RepID=F4QAJ3_CACFS|nr:acyl-CoA oxidase [Cavenderia fasciculata]EGG15712.1 acyl-CoA oxidase [Cavenderia fasciculata]|eukprot:XP_004354454.1 acyl-CoA oxidase [Cavenderia fasciculata]
MDTPLKELLSYVTIQHLKNEITGVHHQHNEGHCNIYDDITSTPLGGSPNVEYLTSLLDGDFKQDRDHLYRLFQNNEEFDEPFLTEPGYTNYKHRERTLIASKLIADQEIVTLEDMKNRPDKFLAWFETISYADLSVSLKFAVQYNLWGGTILFLGTEKHHSKYLSGIQDCTKLGAFGLTELGHGSNVNGLETTATIDQDRKEFIVNSPTWTSQKYWPGNIATHGQFCTVFARLILKGRDHGVHAFVVPIRTPPLSGHPYGLPMPGVEIRDIGLKSSFNGIDNGGLLFKQVRIPLDNMLDRFSRVTESGEYESTIAPNRHFGAMMSVFYIGRLCISVLCLAAAKTAVSIGLSYSHNRKQFGEPGKPEQPIIHHTTQQRRLLPNLARCFALDFAHKLVILTNTMDLKHSYSSGLKAVGAWDCFSATQLARECMGGQGFRLSARVPVLRNHLEVGLTGEGDNTILCQQTSTDKNKFKNY